MADQNKTVANDGDVDAFVAGIEDDNRRTDAQTLLALMREVTGEAPTMWGSSIIGFGHQHLRYASGRGLDNFTIGFAPRKTNSVLYVSGGFDEYSDLLPQLGPHSTGKACLYVKRVADVDQDALRAIVDRSFRWTQPDR